MATPNLDLLNEEYKLQYETLIRFGMTPEEAFDSVYSNQQSEEDAKQQISFQQEQQKALDTKQYDKLDPNVKATLDLLQPDYSKPMVERFMPGFLPEVVPAGDIRQPVSSTVTQEEKRLKPTTLPELQDKALGNIKDYYERHGYPSFQQTQKQNIDKFVKVYGDRNAYILNQQFQGVPTDEAGIVYDTMFEYVKNPPLNITGTASQMAYNRLYGTGGPGSFGPLDTPLQPRRYAEEGTMEPVGPRAGFMQGASPLAEEFRKDPEVARNMPLSDLFTEATRPQVVKTGEEVRAEREQEKQNKMEIEGAIRLLMKDNPQLTGAEAILQLADAFYQQARFQIEKQKHLLPKAEDVMSPSAFGEAYMFEAGNQEQNLEKTIDALAKRAVLDRFKNAGMRKELQDVTDEYNSVLEEGGEFLKWLTTDEYGHGAITDLKESGAVDKDAIVESRTMQYLRNLNMPFRMVINPVMDILFDELGDPIIEDPRTGRDEVAFMEKYSTVPSSPTYDYTEDVEYQANPFAWAGNIADAYMREVLVETATGRTLGNDIVSYQPEVFYSAGLAEDPESIVYSPGLYILGGTLSEIILPISAPVELTANAIKAGAKIPSNIATYGKLARELEGTQIAGVGSVGQQRTWTQATLDALSQDAKVSSKVADDTADTVLALERVANAGDTAKKSVAADVLMEGLGPKGQATVAELLAQPNPSKAATEILTKLSDDASRPTLQAAAKVSTANPNIQRTNIQSTINKASKGGGETINNVTTAERQSQFKSAAFQSLEGKYGLGDYYMVTPRMAISEKARKAGVVEKGIDNVNNNLGPMPEGIEPRIVRSAPFESIREGKTGVATTSYPQRGMPAYEVNYKQQLQTRMRTDRRLSNIVSDIQRGEQIAFEDEFYLRQVLLEVEIENLMRLDTTLKVPRALKLPGMDKSTPLPTDRAAVRVTPETPFEKATSVPATRRVELARAAGTLAKGTSELVGAGVQKVTGYRPNPQLIKAKIQNITRGMKETVWGQTPSKVQKVANDTVISLQRQAPLAMGKLAQTGGNPVDDAFAIGFMGDDYTKVSQMDNAKIPGYAQEKTQAMRDYLTSSVDLTADPRFVETYKAILGSSFDKPEMQALWKRTIQKQLQTTQQADMLNDDVIRNILENMRIANPEALDTAAIAGRPKLRPSAKDVDVEGAKIAMAISGAKAARLDEVAKSLDVLTGAKVVVSEKKYAELGLTKEQAIQLIQIRSQRLLQGTSRGGAAQYMEDWKRITGKDYVDPRPGKKPRGIVQFMSDEFGQESIDLRNYIRYHEQNYIDRGYSVEDAANIIKEQGIPIIFDEQNAKALEKLAPEAFSGVKTAIGRAGLEESIAANIAPLRRASPDVYRYAMDMFDFFIAPRKRIAADNLGGLGLPNPLYHTTNYLSAPIIASVTDPTYIATIIEQQARGLGMAPLASAAKGTFRVNPSVAKDVEMGAVGLQRFISRESMGVQYIGNYTLDEAIYLYRTQNLGQTQTSLQFSTDLVQNVRNQAKTLGPKIGNAALAETLAPGLQAGPWMEIADQTNRMFREAVFFEALSRGHTGEEAAKLARDVLLDFSSMPFAAQEGLGAWVLYSAFTYSLTAELALALTKPKSMAKVTAIANYHRKLSEAMAQSQQTDVRSMVAYQQIDSVYDDQARVYKTYFENPIIDAMSDAINVVENFRLGYVVSQDLLEQAATEAQTMPAGISPETLNLFYDPVLRAFDELSEDNSSVPTSTVYWMSTDQYYGFMSGMQVMEFFDMDYVPLTERKPGVAEVGVDRYAIVDPQTGMITYQTEPLSIEQLEQQKRGGYQIKFKSNEGRQKFIKYNQMLQMTGYNRMMNDITNTLIMSGYLPEGTTFGYTEKGNPVWYNLAGEKIVRIPPEWEKRDRQIKMYESEYKKMLGEFNK